MPHDVSGRMLLGNDVQRSLAPDVRHRRRRMHALRYARRRVRQRRVQVRRRPRVRRRPGVRERALRLHGHLVCDRLLQRRCLRGSYDRDVRLGRRDVHPMRFDALQQLRQRRHVSL
jgi:hypothetical protein